MTDIDQGGDFGLCAKATLPSQTVCKCVSSQLSMLNGHVPVGAERARVGITTTGTLIVAVMGLLEAVTETTSDRCVSSILQLASHCVSSCVRFACGCTCRRWSCNRGEYLYKHAGLSWRDAIFSIIVSGIVVIFLSLTAFWPSQQL